MASAGGNCICWHSDGKDWSFVSSSVKVSHGNPHIILYIHTPTVWNLCMYAYSCVYRFPFEIGRPIDGFIGLDTKKHVIGIAGMIMES